MATITKKINPEFFGAVLSGKKKYELRLNDEEVQEGDTLVLKEWSPDTQEYTGREVTKTVIYTRAFKIEDLHWSKEDIEEKGLRLMSFE